MAKLTPRQRSNIAALWKTGEYSIQKLAKKYKVANATIHKIVKGITKGQNAQAVEILTEAERLKVNRKVIEKVNKTEHIISNMELHAAQQVAKRRAKLEKMANIVEDVGMDAIVKAVEKSRKELDQDLSAGDVVNHTRVVKTAVETARMITKPAGDGPSVVVNNQVGASATATANRIEVVFVEDDDDDDDDDDAD